MSCSWTYEHYSSCLQVAKKQGYDIILFSEAEDIENGKKFIILRHDIEWSVPRALNMARMENSIGVRSTYFVRVHAPNYNIYAYNNYMALQEILSLGHRIGLHFEAIDFSYLTSENPKEVFLKEKTVLEEVLNTNVDLAAAHGEHTTAGPRHNRSFFESISKEEVGIRYNAYDSAFTSNIKYISDSFGFWREGCMCNHIGLYPRMQILVHPCWWFKEHLFE